MAKFTQSETDKIALVNHILLGKMTENSEKAINEFKNNIKAKATRLNNGNYAIVSKHLARLDNDLYNARMTRAKAKNLALTTDYADKDLIEAEGTNRKITRAIKWEAIVNTIKGDNAQAKLAQTTLKCAQTSLEAFVAVYYKGVLFYALNTSEAFNYIRNNPAKFVKGELPRTIKISFYNLSNLDKYETAQAEAN